MTGDWNADVNKADLPGIENALPNPRWFRVLHIKHVRALM